MSKPLPPRIPVNVISGPLGVGKTTTINHLLRHRPSNERWAILVNEYGLIGLDAALMQGSDDSEGLPGVDIREVAGGCICCTAGVMFEISLVLLLRRRPDRLLIEPTGLAALSGILDTLDRPGIRNSVDVQSIVCLLDPSRLDEVLLREEVRDQVDAADVLLASRSDLASEEQLQDFEAWASGLFPAKPCVGQIEQGQMAVDLLHLVSDREVAVQRRGHRHEADEPLQHSHDHDDSHSHDHDSHSHDHESHSHDHASHSHDHASHSHHHHLHPPAVDAAMSCDEAHPILQRIHQSSHISTVGWVCWAGWLFDADRISSWLHTLGTLSGARRIKAVLRTTDGWVAFNRADGVEDRRPSGYRRDSRIEVILEGVSLPDIQMLEQGLKDCLTPVLATGS